MQLIKRMHFLKIRQVLDVLQIFLLEELSRLMMSGCKPFPGSFNFLNDDWILILLIGSLSLRKLRLLRKIHFGVNLDSGSHGIIRFIALSVPNLTQLQKLREDISHP